MQLRWSPAAAIDMEDIYSYLRHNHPSFAVPTMRRIYAAANELSTFPSKGRKGRIPDTRELVLAPLPYIVVYAVEGEHVHIFRIVHGAQDWV